MIREALENQIAVYEKIGYPALLERFVLRNGKEMPSMPRIGEKMQDKECFRNAQWFLDSGGKGLYTEGYAIRPSLEMLIPHAWVAIDGKAMDPTWSNAHEEGCEYFGVTFTAKEALKVRRKTRWYGLLDIGGYNTELIYKMDPELEAIVFEVVRNHKKAWAILMEENA
jgi:hypothetical protein